MEKIHLDEDKSDVFTPTEISQSVEIPRTLLLLTHMARTKELRTHGTTQRDEGKAVTRRKCSA